MYWYICVLNMRYSVANILSLTQIRFKVSLALTNSHSENRDRHFHAQHHFF